MQSFEEFLEDKFNDAEPQILDDDLPDAFASWLGELDGDEYINFAEEYGKYIAKETALNIVDEISRKYN